MQPTLINSVVRALNLLDVVGAGEHPQPAKKLARAVDLPLPTVYHLLRTLVHEGYLRRTPEGYVLGDRVDSLAQGAAPRRVRELLEQLHGELHTAVYLSELKGHEIRVTEIVDSPVAPRVDLWVGFRDAAHATALGKAVLGAISEEARREYLSAHPLVALTPYTQTSADALLTEIEHTRQVAVDREEYAVGVVCAAVPVPGHPKAVAVSVPTRHAGEVFARTRELRRTAQLVALAHG